MRLLKNMENFCLNIYSVEKAVFNMNLSVLQELGILLGGLSDCEELSGGYSQEMGGNFLENHNGNRNE